MIVDTDLFTVAFSNQGATVRSWRLKKYRGNDGKYLELVNVAAGLEFPFSLYFPDKQPTAKVNWTYYTQTGDPDGLGVTYAFSDGHTSVRKVFRFQKNSYLLQVSTEVASDGQAVPHLIEWRGGFGDFTVTSAVANQHTLYFDVTQNKLVEQRANAAKNGPVTASGNFSFAGIADTFFAAVFLPEGNTAMQEVTFSDTVRTTFEEKPAPFVGAAVSDGPTNRFALFVGPKDVDLLKRVNPKLEQVVDFGWLSFLAKPLFLIVNWFNYAFVHNFGWSIVVVTIVINFILFPLAAFQHEVDEEDAGAQAADRHHQRQVQEHQPPRSEKGRPEPGGHGPLQEVRRQPHGRLCPHADSDPVLHRVLQGVQWFRWRCAAPTGCGSRTFPSPRPSPSTSCPSS